MSKKNFISFVRTSAMIIIYTSIEYENNCFEGQIVKSQNLKILGVEDYWSKKSLFQTKFDTKN